MNKDLQLFLNNEFSKAHLTEAYPKTVSQSTLETPTSHDYQLIYSPKAGQLTLNAMQTANSSGSILYGNLNDSPKVSSSKHKTAILGFERKQI